jgi:FKBP-type peptidyl-prolyl cis-trans isomerase
MSLGRGAVYTTSTQLKLDTKSSTESELLAVNEHVTTNFMGKKLYDGTEFQSI